ncbi:MAG TPA: ankyrin repeat domain-containing protein [Vicinamibacterales bacterium]|nr:ankyrin repeat domain-containing protein [Vicinamibacterales bacterium]
MRRRLFSGVCVSAISALCLSAVLAAAAAAPVAEAAMAGNKETVRALLKQGMDVNAAQGDGMTALHWAARQGDVELAQMLLYAGANVKASTRLGGYTPLLMAAQVGHATMLEMLIKSGADAKVATANGTTPLMMAATAGKADAVKLLLDHGADPNVKESARGETALMFAANFNRVDAMKALLDKGADITAATKVVDLAGLTSPDEEFFRQQQQGGAPAPGAPAAPAEGQGGPAGARGPGSPGGGPGSPAAPGAPAPAGPGGGGARGAAPAAPRGPDIAGVTRQYRFNELVSTQGGLTPILFAARQGHIDAVKTLLAAGADINQVSTGDKTSPVLMALINGHYDLAKFLIEQGADVKAASDAGVTPLYAVLNVQWAPKALYPQPRAYTQQKATHLEMMKLLIEKGADVNARLKMKVWYSGYNFDLAGVDEVGATPFWRAAYASDVDAMKLLVGHGADPKIASSRPAGRPRTGDGGRESVQDVSGLPPVPVGGAAVTPLQAASGVGYAEGFAANSHRYAPGGMLAAVKYLIEEVGADVNALDHEGNNALHHAASRGDVEMILYLVSKGADVKAVNREGQTTADMANGPVQRTQPYPEALELLVKLGAKNNNKCVSC